MTGRLIGVARKNWFYLLPPFAALASLNLRATIDWRAEGALGEAVTLFDWCVFLPAMLALCYRNSLSGKVLALRMVGAVCGGLWVAGMIVPDEHQHLVGAIAWLRYPGLGILFLAEALVLVALLKVSFSKTPDGTALVRLGVPRILAKLMIAEARFWRWVWRQVRGG